MVMLWENFKSFGGLNLKQTGCGSGPLFCLKKAYPFSVLYPGTLYNSIIATEQLEKK